MGTLYFVVYVWCTEPANATRLPRRVRRPANKTKTPPVAAFSPFPPPRPAPGKSRGTRPGLAATRRGRRPRRPERSSAAHLATFRRPLVGAGFRPRPDAGMTADPVSPHQPCRGRRPRRPLPSVTASPTAAQGLRAAEAARKGGTPGEGSPFNPLLRFVSREKRPGAPPLDPARFFVKKRGKKLLNANSPPTQTPRRGGE